MMSKLEIFIGFFIFHALLSNSSAQNWLNDNSCTTPNNYSGNCINIYLCPPLMQILLNRPVSTEGLQSLRNSQCGYEGKYPKVCCPVVNNITCADSLRQNNPDVNINSRSVLLPSDCGRDSSLRIVGGERADLDEFPWMALIEYQTTNGLMTECGGVLISKRYVLTAAHCLKNQHLPESWRIMGVRLGEYDTATDIDCIPDSEDSEICAPPIVSVGIEEQIVHENYDPASKNQENDIALLRLSEDIKFTDYIKPICVANNSEIAQKLWVAGWGKTETRSSSNVKLKVRIPLADKNKCQSKYRNVEVNVGAGQICAGGQREKDSCQGDSGGPLMSFERETDGTAKWSAVGIVSFGPTPCGLQGWPGVYTKVVDFTDWILKNMKP